MAHLSNSSPQRTQVGTWSHLLHKPLWLNTPVFLRSDASLAARGDENKSPCNNFWWLVFWKPLTQSEIREVQVWGKRILWFLTQRGRTCLRLLISLWTSVASMRRAVSHHGREVRAKWKGFCVRALDEAGRQQRQVHKEFSLFYSCLTKPTCFCFSWSCPCTPCLHSEQCEHTGLYFQSRHFQNLLRSFSSMTAVTESINI